MAHSFFGGEIEETEVAKEALIRELKEEIKSDDLVKHIQFQKIAVFLLQGENEWKFHFYEGIVDDEYFEMLPQLDILEGYGKLIEPKLLKELDWIWGLEAVVEYYL